MPYSSQPDDCACTIVLSIHPASQGDYAVRRDGRLLITGRRALPTVLSAMLLEGANKDVPIIVQNAADGRQSEAFTIREYPEVLWAGTLPLPQTKRARARARWRDTADMRLKAPASADGPTPNLPPMRGHYRVWIDQRAKPRPGPQV